MQDAPRKLNKKKAWKIYKGAVGLLFIIICIVYLALLFVGTAANLAGSRAKTENGTIQAGGMVKSTAGVPANSFNQMADQLKLKEDRVSEFESKLNESSLRLGDAMGDFQKVILVNLAVIGGLLLFLIIINYCLDWYWWKSNKNGN